MRAQEVGGRRALKGGSLEEDGGAKLAPLRIPHRAKPAGLAKKARAGAAGKARR